MGEPSSIRFAAVILAAGASTRMGEPKMLLPWGKSSIIGHIISEWTSLGAEEVAVVTAPPVNPVTQELDQLQFPVENRIMNPLPHLGMFSSVQSSARWQNWTPGLTHWILVLGDQPQISLLALESLIEHVRDNPGKVCQLSRNGRAKHPVALPGFAFEKLRTSEAENLREFLSEFTNSRSLCDCPDESLDYDLDYRKDYEMVRRKFSA